MDDTVLQFYNQLAGNYHLIFADWRESVLRQGAGLDDLIRAQGVSPPCAVLDCACGIGTQAIGLATRGYRVHATDLSPAAAERAAREAEAFKVTLTTGIADMRALEQQVAGTFRVVIACDNALPHLLSDEDLLLAARNIATKLPPDGLFLASIRDYDQLAVDKPRATTPRVYDEATGRRIYFQVWDWADDGRSYTLHLFLVKEAGQQWQTEHYTTRYRALLRRELTRILAEAGFRDIRWHMPGDSGYYQPVVTARLSG